MSEEEIRRRGQEIQNQLADHLSKELNIPVFSVSKELIDKLYEDVRDLPGVEENYSSDELYDEVSDFLSKLIVFQPSSSEELEARIDGFTSSLQIEKTYEATLILPSVIDLPIGTKIGCLEIAEQGIDDDRFLEYLNYLTEHESIHIEGRSQAKVEFKAFTTVRVTDVLYELLELPFAILSLILEFDLDPRDCVGFVKSADTSKGHFLKPHREIIGWARYHSKRIGEQLDQLSNITLVEKPTRLQRKILQAIQVYGLSRLSRKPEIRFIFLISALESLVLTENDRDYLGKKLAEKIAFVLENEYERRLELYKLMKRYYGKRSSIIHRGDIRISSSEVRTLQGIFRELAFRLLDLSTEYGKMEQKAHEDDSEGIEDHINRFKFS